MAPALGCGTKSRLMLRPIVKRRRIEIGSTWPGDGMKLRVESHLSERRRIAQQPIKLAPREFLRRVLSHVLPDGLHKVRYFGYLHPKARRRYHQVALLLESPIRLTHPAPKAPPLDQRGPPGGGIALQIVGRLPRCRDP
jgi:hypothetical protein